MYTNENLINDLNSELEIEIEKEQSFAKENFTKEALKKHNVTNNVMRFILNKILHNFKIKVTVTYKDNVLFEYEIPKN